MNWQDDAAKVATVTQSIRETYSGPWGLKASSDDVIHDAAKALGLDVDTDGLGDRLWDWTCDQPSPFTEGLASLVDDGLQVGAVVPTAEIAGEADTATWETRQAQFVLALLQERSEP